MPFFKKSFTIFSLFATCTSLTWAQSNDTYSQGKVDKLDKVIRAYAEYGKFNGSVLIGE